MTVTEKIAGLPVAINIAQLFEAQLVQAKRIGQMQFIQGQMTNEEKSQSTLTTESSSLMKSLYAADCPGYTKADAVNKQWRKINTVNLFDVLNGTADTSDRSLSAEDVEKRLKEGGLLDEVSDIDFSMLQFELSGIRSDSGKAYKSVDSGEFYKNVEYLASRYAAMEDKITYAGAEQKQRLDKLNDMYEAILERAAKSYSEIVGGILEGYGVSNEKEKIYQSFKDDVDQKVAQYRSFLAKNQDFTGLEGTEDAWLLKDDEYIAAKLREQDVVSETMLSKNGGYSLQELDILGQYASSLSSMAAKSNPYEMNEERIGLDLAMLTMKTETLSKNGKVSSALDTTLQKALNGYLNAFLEQFNSKLDTNRKHAQTGYDIQGNAKRNKDAVWLVYNKTMEYYRIPGNVMEALIKGGEYGKLQYSERMNLERLKDIYRYKDDGFYWNDFYNKKGSVYDGWLDFENSLREGDM